MVCALDFRPYVSDYCVVLFYSNSFLWSIKQENLPNY